MTPRRIAEDIAFCLVFFTRLPLPALDLRGRALAQAIWAAPLVGVAVAILTTVVHGAASAAGLSPEVAAALTLAATMLITGCLHEDGLSDVADGFGGGKTRERKLEIMRDSRIGAYGVLALVLITLVRVGALAALDGAKGFAALLAAAALARGIAAVPMSLLPHARADGLGRSAGRAPAPAAAIAIILGIGIALAATLGYGYTPRTIGIGIALAILAALFVSLLALRHIGGTTGDVLGATILAAEAAVLTALASG